MLLTHYNWMQLEHYLEQDDRIVLPLGSTEQHAYLSLATDTILAERIAAEAAEPLGVAVLPALPYGVTPRFAAYPGSPSLTAETYVVFLSELIGSLRGQGFGRILIVNAHGGNCFAAEHVAAAGVIWHDWWNSDAVLRAIRTIDPDADHASWTENYPWTRLSGVELPTAHKDPVRVPADAGPGQLRCLAGDGSFGGDYQRPEGELSTLWRLLVEETRNRLVHGWSN